MDKKEIQNRMGKTLSSLQDQLLGLRAGNVTPALVNKVVVDAYGSKMPLNQLANIGASPDGKTIIVDPWDKTVLKDIVKALQAENLGANPISDGTLIRLAFPPLSTERRNELVKLVEKYGEESKISVRNIRRDEINNEKKAEKDGDISEDDLKKNQSVIQEITDEFTKNIESVITSKKKDILES